MGWWRRKKITGKAAGFYKQSSLGCSYWVRFSRLTAHGARAGETQPWQPASQVSLDRPRGTSLHVKNGTGRKKTSWPCHCVSYHARPWVHSRPAKHCRIIGLFLSCMRVHYVRRNLMQKRRAPLLRVNSTWRNLGWGGGGGVLSHQRLYRTFRTSLVVTW